MIDKSYYSSTNERGVQEDLTHFASSCCNAMAIFQCAYFEENRRYASRLEEMKVIAKLVMNPSWAGTGLPLDKSSAYVTSHYDWLNWLQKYGFLTQKHNVIILDKSNKINGNCVVCFETPGFKDKSHFINAFVKGDQVKVTHDGYRTSQIVLFSGQPESFRYYPIMGADCVRTDDF